MIVLVFYWRVEKEKSAVTTDCGHA